MIIFFIKMVRHFFLNYLQNDGQNDMISDHDLKFGSPIAFDRFTTNTDYDGLSIYELGTYYRFVWMFSL